MSKATTQLGRRLRLGIIGGGESSFIGQIHRSSATMHEEFEVTASVLSSSPQQSVKQAERIGIARPYATAEALFAGEQAHPQPIDALAIITPNDTHYRLACQALDQGMHIMCEKPMTNDLREAEDLAQRVKNAGTVFAVGYCYSGFPMVRQARAMIEQGAIGDVRMVQVNYVQGHLAEMTEAEQQGTNWHFDPAIGGQSLVTGDIATHCYHLASFVCGMHPKVVAADLTNVVPGRKAHDYCGLLLHYPNGARATMWVTQAAAGGVHGLGFEIYGSKGGLIWQQEFPDQLHYRQLHLPEQVLVKRGPGLHPAAERLSHIALGHPEGYREAFANLYLDFASHIIAHTLGSAPDPLDLWYPGITDGVAGVQFVQDCLNNRIAV